VAEVHGNRTHRTYLPVNPTGFEVQASHQARFTSASVRLYHHNGSEITEDKERAVLPRLRAEYRSRPAAGTYLTSQTGP
jgi:hypothetical protein